MYYGNHNIYMVPASAFSASGTKYAAKDGVVIISSDEK
jgi:fructoselysine-6-P-deglycase FrlB-like protein